MNLNRLALLLSLLVLIFFVSTSSGLADISSAQEQLRALQLKLVGQKIKQLQDAVLGVSKPKPEKASISSSAPAPTPEEMQSRIQTQISALELLVASLQPRAIEERTSLLEARISAINQEIRSATGARLQELQADLQSALADYDALRQDVRAALDVSLKEQQAAALRQQIRALQEKVLLIPRVSPPPAPAPPTNQYPVLESQLQQAKLKLIQAQSNAIQEKIDQLKAR